MVAMSVSAVHEKMQQRASEENQIGQHAQRVRPMINDKHPNADGEETEHHPSATRL